MATKIFGGKKITIRRLSGADSKRVKEFQEFINSAVLEDAQISLDRNASIEEETRWMQWQQKRMKSKKVVFLVGECGGRIISTTEISLNLWRKEHVGTFGIIIKNGYRGLGLGTYLMKEIIKLAKKELKPFPKIIKLSVFSTNKPALALYRKLDFKTVAKIPKQVKYKEKLVDEIIMLKYLW